MIANIVVNVIQNDAVQLMVVIAISVDSITLKLYVTRKKAAIQTVERYDLQQDTGNEMMVF